MCAEPATSREHVPPKCIFPEKKDIGGNYREDLITVPSCDKHNSKKSKDDEFLMVSLAGIIGNNSIGYKHKFGKVDRAIKRSANRLLEKIFKKKEKKCTYQIDENKFIEVIWGTPDIDRLNNCFEHIAYGLYYNHYQERFAGDLKILLGYLSSQDSNSENFKKFIKHKLETELRNTKQHGKNQEVFYYQFTPPDEFGLFALKICFYGGLEIYCAFIPKSTSLPANFAMELMNKGIKTIIHHDGKNYEFN